jgi:hypothetical protein
VLITPHFDTCDVAKSKPKVHAFQRGLPQRSMTAARAIPPPHGLAVRISKTSQVWLSFPCVEGQKFRLGTPLAPIS